MNLIDSHAHMDLEGFDQDRDQAFDRAWKAGLTSIMNVAMGPDTAAYERSIKLCEKNKGVYSLIGIHPHDAKKFSKESLFTLESYSKNPLVLGMGEMGLDYYYRHSSEDEQKFCFEAQASLALSLDLPISIHLREAFEDCVDILTRLEFFSRGRMVFHCFTGSKDQATFLAGKGAYLSYSGILTFKNASALREAVFATPLDQILIETDCPFLAPVPHRGKRNEPSFIVETCRVIAEIKNLSIEEVAEATTKNARELFAIPLP